MPQEAEYEYLIKVIKDLGYKPATASGWAKDGGFIFDLFKGKKIHTTDLLESPLQEGNHLLAKEFKSIYLGVLNFYDLIISKFFRGSGVDVEDCLETASYDVSEEKVNKNFTHFVQILKKQGLYDEK
ncbi:MAG: hypothetical protein AAB213_00770 [Candidatus Omnitrophota bacterium]